mmetsp:Transcript_7035/g.20546  ORF Transcript_7035/g.20546 Transcript_7035/m.20546 type:complete len:200 (-) Transcript_7035:6-605(-)
MESSAFSLRSCRIWTLSLAMPRPSSALHWTKNPNPIETYIVRGSCTLPSANTPAPKSTRAVSSPVGVEMLASNPFQSSISSSSLDRCSTASFRSGTSLSCRNFRYCTTFSRTSLASTSPILSSAITTIIEVGRTEEDQTNQSTNQSINQSNGLALLKEVTCASRPSQPDSHPVIGPPSTARTPKQASGSSPLSSLSFSL